MKIHAVKDKTGKVVATYEKATGDAPAVTPVLEHGHTSVEIEVADNYKANLKAVYEQHGS